MTKLPKLTADVFNHPECPGWANWAAVDIAGRVWVFISKPCLISNWVSNSDAYFLCSGYSVVNWQNSLIERPAADLPEHDDVKAPSYYVNTPFGMELKKITCHYDFNCGSALKYIIRHGKKIYGGMTAKESAIKDLGKAIESLQNEIEYIKEKWEE